MDETSKRSILKILVTENVITKKLAEEIWAKEEDHCNVLSTALRISAPVMVPARRSFSTTKAGHLLLFSSMNWGGLSNIHVTLYGHNSGHSPSGRTCG